jgi:hypothetical protein
MCVCALVLVFKKNSVIFCAVRTVFFSSSPAIYIRASAW